MADSRPNPDEVPVDRATWFGRPDADANDGLEEPHLVAPAPQPTPPRPMPPTRRVAGGQDE